LSLPVQIAGAIATFLAGGWQVEQSDWRRYATDHFEMWTQAEPGLARQAVRHLEGVWSRLLSGQYPGMRAPAGRLKVIAFSSEREFARFRADSGSPAYFVGGPNGGFVVLGRLTKDSSALLTHELAHALLRSSGQALPWWIAEGMAEVAAHPPSTRTTPADAGFLQSRCATPPASHHLRACYVQARRQIAWLLATPAGRAGLFLKMGAPPAAASGPAGTWNGQIGEQPAGWTVHAQLAALAAHLDRVQQALDEYNAGPAEPSVLRLIGLRAIAQGRLEQGSRLLNRAYRLGDRDPEMLRQLASAEQSAPSGLFFRYMEDLLAVDPADDSARLILASHYLFRGDRDAARRHLAAMRAVPAGCLDYFRRAALAAGLPAMNLPSHSDD